MAEAEDKGKAEAGAEGADAAKAAPKGKSKLLLVVGAVVLLLVAIAVPVALMLGGKKEEHKDTDLLDADAAHSDGGEKLVIEGLGEEDELEEGEEPLGAILPMESFVVNLTEGGYLRLQAQLEFNAREVPRRFYTKVVPIRDSLLTLLASKRVEELSEPRGRDTLRTQIKDVINEVLRKEEVKHVYFTQFVLQ
jgi:flagellar FliL protein